MTTPDSLPEWNDLLDRLLTGTRDQLAPADLFASLSPGRALLSQLALTGTMQRAGYVPTRERRLPQADPAPSDSRPPCSLRAIDWLLILHQHSTTHLMIYDWCIAIERQGQRIPVGEVEFVMAMGSNNPDLLPYIACVIGARGHWLAHQSDSFKALRAPELWGPDRPPLTPSPTPQEIHKRYPNASLDTLVQVYQRMMREITA